ncbi:MAG: carboxymuconolactone decarboxylase family protein [Rhodospirillales bacterium]|nr:carboxymuconolactone decarboxylase family protein [Rhodospirillales bacterium]
MTDSPKIPDEIARYIDPYYVESFGEMPPLPAQRMALGAEIAPEFTQVAEEFRALALYSDVLDKKTSQLLAFCLLVSRASAGSYWHAKAARKYGATWQELHKVMEIAALMTGVGAMNEGGQALVRLWKEEHADDS